MNSRLSLRNLKDVKKNWKCVCLDSKVDKNFEPDVVRDLTDIGKKENFDKGGFK